MNTNHSNTKSSETITLDELARKIDALAQQISQLREELHWRQAEEVAARIDRGEERLVPLEVLERVLNDDVTPLKAIREWRGMRQEELARMVGTSKAYISQIETRHRRPGRKLLFRLAEALDVAPELLLED